MKKLWTVISVLALANVLAIAGVLGWLSATDRLSKDRVRMLRETFSRTVSQEAQAKSEEAAQVEKTKAETAAAEKLARLPINAADQIKGNGVEADGQLQVILRRQKEVESLRESLNTQIASIESRERKLNEERAAFESLRKRIAEMEGATQFKSALATLESQKPKDAKAVLGALLASRQHEQVVAYLAKMEEGKRVKVMAEFVKEDPALAADLLERLRTRGGVNAQSASSAAGLRGQTNADSANPDTPAGRAAR